ncbi:hypothetical protein DB30_08124 [Enhygromyxa salina]|uniref:Uncharacterized protein n=1 Tax=Enhygromyxa salina TaxID=215803 RepID=A0A0C2CZR1_9BACT|nr:hypothetical protein DB30_08124 [Enhygromyxa salina]
MEIDAWPRMRAAMLIGVVDSAPSKAIACAVLGLSRSLLREPGHHGATARSMN